MIRAMLALLVALGIAAAPARGSSPSPRAGDAAAVNSPDNVLNLRTAPSASARLVFALPQGTRVRIIQSLDNGWMKVVVEAFGDTGQKPKQSLMRFVNGKFLILTKNDIEAEYGAMKGVMGQYLGSPTSGVNFGGIDASDGRKRYDINDCMVGANFVPTDAGAQIRSLAALAYRVVHWSHFLPRLGYPENIWKPLVDRYEREAFAKIIKESATNSELTLDLPTEGVWGSDGVAHDALGSVLATYRRTHPNVGDIIAHTSCGEDLAAIEIRTEPAGARMLFIPIFFHDLCRVRNLDPDDPSVCNRWREPLGGKLTQVAGDYFYIVHWPDGSMRKGRFSLNGYSGGDTLIMRQN